jgi:type IV pilus assembly protein PilM
LNLRPNTKSRSVVGLDIEPGFVTAAEVSVNGRLVLERAVGAPLATDVMRDGELTDPDALAETLRALFAEHKLGRRVRLGLANQRIVMRTLTLPPIEDAKQLSAAVHFQAQDEIPMPLDTAVLDFQTIGLVETPEGTRQQVVLVAARRDMIERLLEATRAAGLKPQGIDLSAFAMVRALPGDDLGSDPRLLLSVGGLTNLAVAEGRRCLFTRVVGGGLEAMATDLAERRGLALEQAREWLVRVGLTAPVEELEGDPDVVADARTVLGDGARRIAGEVRNSLEFHAAHESAKRVSHAVLTGAILEIDGFDHLMAAELGMPVDAGVVADAHADARTGLPAGRATVAAGLGVEESSS